MDRHKQPQKEKGPRRTEGEGAPRRQRKGSVPKADEIADPQRGEGTEDGRLIERRRDARNPEGL